MANSTPLTPQEFEAALAEASKGVTPAERKPTPLSEQLVPYRKILMKYRTAGYSAEQIAQFLRQPKIGVDASPSFIRKFVSVKHREAKKSSMAINAATAARPA